jgi:hypothetical protein
LVATAALLALLATDAAGQQHHHRLELLKEQDQDHWYPNTCCDQRDCRPYPAASVRRTPGGWRLHDGTLVPFEAALPSGDRRFHRCDTPNGVLRTLDKSNKCFFVPEIEG